MTALFWLAAFASSAALFLLELIYGRLILPRAGGTPSVWNTCLFFYQAALFAGYVGAALIQKFVTSGRIVLLHAALLFVAIPFLPPALPEGWRPDFSGSPSIDVFLVMFRGIAVPFMVLAATGILLQAILARTGRDPYFLYAAGNTGSFAAIIAYPFLIEPLLALSDQKRLWSALFAVTAVLALWAGLLAIRRAGANPGPREAGDKNGTAAVSADTSPRQILRWILYAALPSSLLLGTTMHLTTDISPIPFLWILPLGIYLATYALAFARRQLLNDAAVARAVPLLAIPAVIWFSARLRPHVGLWIPVLLDCGVLFAVSLALHRSLARSRPPARALGIFYGCLSLGGALGGSFNVFVAPHLFDTIAEYPLALALACFLVERPDAVASTLRRDLAAAATVGASPYLLARAAQAVSLDAFSLEMRFLAVAIGGLATILFLSHPRRLAFSLAALFAGSLLVYSMRIDMRLEERTYFGIHRVYFDRGSRQMTLAHGTTLHGSQHADTPMHAWPLMYYFPDGPAAEIFQALPDGPRRTAVVGLGAGSLAWYNRPDDDMTFLEIDPLVREIASNPALFTFMENAQGKVSVAVGDGRILMEDIAPESLDLIVLDAFSSDAVPVHLLTREAFRLYISRLKPRGVIAFHLSNFYLNLVRAVAPTAFAEGLVPLVRADRAIHPAARAIGKAPSVWMVVGRDTASVAIVARNPGWLLLDAEMPYAAWSDDYANLIAILN